MEDNAYKEYAISKCEDSIRNNKEYQELNKYAIEIENKLKNELSGKTLDLLLKYINCSCKQSVIYTENLIDVLLKKNL